MTKKPDLGIIVAIVSGAAVVAAIVWGLIAVGSPDDARHQRIDEAHYQEMLELATAAQCVYRETGALPANMDDLRTGVADTYASDGECRRTPVATGSNSAVSYEVAGPDQINLCAEFHRASPYRDGRHDVYNRFPELVAPRAEIGRRCYLIRLRA